MINFKNNEIIVDSLAYPIKNFVVKFQTPRGLCATIEEALDVVEKLDLDEMAIRPVPVAVAESGYEEVMS